MGLQLYDFTHTDQWVMVFDAADFRVVEGAELNAPVMQASELLLGDVYRLARGARSWRMGLTTDDGVAPLTVGPGSQLGHLGASVYLDGTATFMAPNGTVVEALVAIEVEASNALISEIYLLPLGDLETDTDYALIAVDTMNTRGRFDAAFAPRNESPRQDRRQSNRGLDGQRMPETVRRRLDETGLDAAIPKAILELVSTL